MLEYQGVRSAQLTIANDQRVFGDFSSVEEWHEAIVIACDPSVINRRVMWGNEIKMPDPPTEEDADMTVGEHADFLTHYKIEKHSRGEAAYVMAGFNPEAIEKAEAALNAVWDSLCAQFAAEGHEVESGAIQPHRPTIAIGGRYGMLLFGVAPEKEQEG